MSLTKPFALLLIVLCSIETAAAKQVYISDKLYVPLRSGQGTQFRIVHRGLKSGTSLSFVEASEDEKWTRITTPSGIDGWIQTQYISETPTAAIQLKAANETIAALQSKAGPLNKQLSTALSTNRKLERQLDSASKENTRLKAELAAITKISKNAINLHSSNKTLAEQQSLLNNEIDVLKADNLRLREDKTSQGFINGVAAVLIGVIITLVAPLFRRKKGHSEWG